MYLSLILLCYCPTSDAPPSYEQIFGVGQMKQQVQEARSESSNKGVFAAKLCEIFCGSGELTLFLTLGAHAHEGYGSLSVCYRSTACLGS